MSNNVLDDKEFEAFFNIESTIEENNNIQLFKVNDETNTISSDVSEFTLKLKIKEFDSEKALFKFVKSVEKLVRTSPEYSIWRDYIKNVMEMQRCQITGEINSETTVDIHHTPFTLMDLVLGCINRRMDRQIEFCSYDICEEVIKMHYDMKAPFVLLVSSLHEKVHNGALKIPNSFITGDYNYFMKEYYAFLPEENQSIIDEKIKTSVENCGWKKGYKWILDKND